MFQIAYKKKRQKDPFYKANWQSVPFSKSKLGALETFQIGRLIRSNSGDGLVLSHKYKPYLIEIRTKIICGILTDRVDRHFPLWRREQRDIYIKFSVIASVHRVSRVWLTDIIIVCNHCIMKMTWKIGSCCHNSYLIDRS